MVFKRIISFVVITMLFISSGCSENNPNKTNGDTLRSENEYDFENMVVSNDVKSNQHSIDEYEKIQREIANILNSESMDEVIIIVNGVEITREDFETQKMLSIYNYGTFSIKEIVYSLIKPLVINTEAERLNLKTSQDRVNQYMEGVRLALTEDKETKEFIDAYVNGRGITLEDYLKEQEEMAYQMFQREALYDYIEDATKNADIDEYIYNLLKYANIQINDSEIKEACLEH